MITISFRKDYIMKITIIFTGKTKEKYIEAGMREYLKRLRHFIPVELLTIPDIKSSRGLTQKEYMEKEAEAIMRKIPERSVIILLDERGQQFDSIELSRYFEKKSLESRDLCFIVGGPYGFGEDIYSKADDKISLSRLTFSHQMVRLIFVEQLYRSFTILRGHPYHHG
jgi:23S rRNA (pseudouridine1915-N3)-methyltransferase